MNCPNCDHPGLAHGANGCIVGSALTDQGQGCGCPLDTYLASKCPEGYRISSGSIVDCTRSVGHQGDHEGFYPGDSRPSRWRSAEEEKVATFEQGLTPGRAADTQVGGDHYRQTPIQPWDVIDAYDLGFYAGNTLKYLLRAGRKGPALEDLKKARHYLDKMIEKEEG